MSSKAPTGGGGRETRQRTTTVQNITKPVETVKRTKPAQETSPHENPDFSTRAARIETRGIPFKSADRVVSCPKKAKGRAKIRGRYGVDSEKGTTVGEKKRPPSDDCGGNQYQTVGGSRGHLGRDGEKGIIPIGPSGLEISAELSRTPSIHRNPHISTTIKCRLGDARLQEANDSARNCMSYGVSEVGVRRAASHRDVRGELGERGNKGNGAPNPEIFAKRCDPACLPKNCDIFGCTETAATKSISYERYRRVRPESQFARGTDELSSRYRVGEVGDDKGARLPDTR
ncbi:hypothetical protein EDD15DRAFT_2199602 [Pisolithus albus]|nr:hypothetical protein EDD15DRAFT_2199602 [Pisolithus albus]